MNFKLRFFFLQEAFCLSSPHLLGQSTVWNPGPLLGCGRKSCKQLCDYFDKRCSKSCCTIWVSMCQLAVDVCIVLLSRNGCATMHDIPVSLLLLVLFCLCKYLPLFSGDSYERWINTISRPHDTVQTTGIHI